MKDKIFKIELSESRHWVVLGRPVEELTSIRLKWRHEKLLETKGRVLDLASADLDGDGLDDLILLFADHLEFWKGERKAGKKLIRKETENERTV